MAASGCLDEERSEALAEHSAVRKKSLLLDIMLPERIYQRTEFDFVRSGPPSGGASGGKCLVERLGAAVVNKVVGSGVASSSSSPALGLVGNRDGYQPPSEFAAERRNHRYDRAASTDSVATSSGESCRSSSDSASSAPCSPESVLSDSGGAEGLPDSVASLVSGDLGDLGDATPDSGFNLSRLLLPQQHRQGESAADARKRDLRLVDEVVAAATAAASDSCCAAASSPASPRPQSSALAAATALSFSSALASSLSSSSSATSVVTSSATGAVPFLTTCSTSTVAASLVVPPASVSSSVTSSVSSVPVSSSSCSGPVVSHAELCAAVPPPSCRHALPLTSQKCVPQVASPAPHPGGCAKSRRKRKFSGDARRRDGTAVSDEEPEDEDICRRREAEVESLLRHCVDLVAERLDPRRSTTSSSTSTTTSTTASSSSICTSPLRNHREQHQPELRRHHESHHQAATAAASPRSSHRHQDHRQQRESRHQERHAQEDCEEASRSHHVLEHRTGHHHHHSLPNCTSQPNHNSQQQQKNHKKQHHLRQAALEAPLPPPSPDCSSSRSIPDEEESGCLLESETTPNTDTSAAALSKAVSPTTAPPRAASPTIGSSTGISPAKVSTAVGPSTSSAASSSTPCTSSSSSFAAAPSPCSSTQSSVVAGEDGLFSCRWLDCEMRLRSEEALGDHVRAAHVDTQTRDQGIYACRWQGCKVFERRSCSRQWLERHVTLSHCGSRPFPCIVAGCGQRFGSQGALQRHVNAHFERSLNGSGPVPVGGGAGASGSGSGLGSGGSLLGSRGFSSKELANGESPLKLLRLRKKLKCRRRAWATAKHADFFDAGVMEELKHRLADISAPQSPAEPHSWNGSTVTFHGTVVARRKENTGKVKVLLHWVPEHVLPDSWVFENQSMEQVVALSSLSAEDLHTLNLWPKDLPSPCQGSPCQGSQSTVGRRRKRK